MFGWNCARARHVPRGGDEVSFACMHHRYGRRKRAQAMGARRRARRRDARGGEARTAQRRPRRRRRCAAGAQAAAPRRLGRPPQRTHARSALAARGARARADARQGAGGRRRTISEVKRTRGGLSGYCSGKVSRMAKMPPSHAVSSVPKIVPPHTCRLSSPRGLALTPSGGDCFMVLRSDRSRRLEADDEAMAPNARINLGHDPVRAQHEQQQVVSAAGYPTLAGSVGVGHSGRRLSRCGRRKFSCVPAVPSGAARARKAAPGATEGVRGSAPADLLLFSALAAGCR